MTITLDIRPVRDSDLERYRAMLDHPDMARMTGSITCPVDLDQAKERRLRHGGGELYWCQGIYAGDNLVGEAGAFEGDGGLLEVGYLIAKECHGKGLATKALACIIDRVRASGYQGEIIAAAFNDNPASHRVLEKNGFIACGETNHYSAERKEKAKGTRFRLTAPA